MEAQRERRSGVRKPLGDCTNTLAPSHSSLRRYKPRNPALPSAVDKLLSDSGAKSTPRNNAVPDRASVPPPPPPPPPPAATPPRPPLSSSEPGKVDCERVEPCSVYSRRRSADKIQSKSNPTEEPLSNTLAAEKRKSKGKEIAEPFTCPPPTKIRKIWKKINEDTGHNLPKACTAPPKKKQGHRSSAKDSNTDALPADYIEQQRAYFAEIDAFELPEEEVESIDELE